MDGVVSGQESTDVHALDRVLADAQSLRITPGGCLVYSVDPEANVLDPTVPKFVQLMSDALLAHVTAPTALQELRSALAVTEVSGGICMCPGDLALEFLDADGRRVTVVRVDSPGTLDWPLWTSKADVADKPALRKWLRDHGAEGPLLAVEAHMAKWAAQDASSD